MRKAAALFFLLALHGSAVAHADDMGLQDFAYGLTITVPSDATIAEVPLPDSIYRKVVFPDFRDVRVFNQDGDTVRHSLSLPRTSTKQEEYQPRFFPVYGKKMASGTSISILATDGVSGVRAYLSGAKPGELETAAYLVDLRELQKREAQPAVTSVVVGWRGVPPGIAIQVFVEGSDDLQSWHPIQSGVVLGRFKNQGQELLLDRIDLPHTRNAYLKIYTEGDPKWEITGLRVWLEERTLRNWERRWETPLRVDTREKASPGTLEYTLEGAFLVDQLRVPLRDNQVIDLTLYSKHEASAGWIRRGGGTVYRFAHAGRDVTSPPLKIEAAPDRFWKLEAKGTDLEEALNGVSPQFGWVAHMLRFVPKGSGPYTIAYGNGRAAKSEFKGENIEATVRRALDEETPIVSRASVLSTQILGGEARLALPDTSAKATALWAILIACVLFFGFIAWRLFREIQHGENPS